MCGSTTHIVATAATAASAAVPPARSVSTAASVASGCDVAAMPSPEITGERPGSWKSRLMTKPGMLERSGRNVLDPFNREIALRGAQCHGEAPEHVDEAHHQQQEECRGCRLFDHDELHHHPEENHQRQAMIDDSADTDASRFQNLAAQQHDRQGDKHVAGR